MKRFRLVTLFVVTAAVALLVASLTSHYRARIEVRRLDSEIKAALEELAPEVSSRLKINVGREEFPPLNPYSFGGNGVETGLGGIINGPSAIARNVVVPGGVNLTIETRSNWGLIPRNACVTIHAHDGDENDWFISCLKNILERRGVAVDIGD